MKNDTLYFHTCGICSRLWPQHCTGLVLTKLVYLTRGLSRLQLALLRFPCSRLRQSYFICSYVSGVIFMCPHCSMQDQYSEFVFIAAMKECNHMIGVVVREGSCAFKCSNRVMLQWRLHVPVLQRGGTIGWPLICPWLRLCLFRT